MGQCKSKGIDDGSGPVFPEAGPSSVTVKRTGKKNRKWRKKQGYSLPSGLDTTLDTPELYRNKNVGGNNAVGRHQSFSHHPVRKQSGAVLVSYNKTDEHRKSWSNLASCSTDKGVSTSTLDPLEEKVGQNDYSSNILPGFHRLPTYSITSSSAVEEEEREREQQDNKSEYENIDLKDATRSSHDFENNVESVYDYEWESDDDDDQVFLEEFNEVDLDKPIKDQKTPENEDDERNTIFQPDTKKIELKDSENVSKNMMKLNAEKMILPTNITNILQTGSAPLICSDENSHQQQKLLRSNSIENKIQSQLCEPKNNVIINNDEQIESITPTHSEPNLFMRPFTKITFNSHEVVESIPVEELLDSKTHQKQQYPIETANLSIHENYFENVVCVHEKPPIKEAIHEITLENTKINEEEEEDISLVLKTNESHNSHYNSPIPSTTTTTTTHTISPKIDDDLESLKPATPTRQNTFIKDVTTAKTTKETNPKLLNFEIASRAVENNDYSIHTESNNDDSSSSSSSSNTSSIGSSTISTSHKSSSSRSRNSSADNDNDTDDTEQIIDEIQSEFDYLNTADDDEDDDLPAPHSAIAQEQDPLDSSNTSTSSSSSSDIKEIINREFVHRNVTKSSSESSNDDDLRDSTGVNDMIKKPTMASEFLQRRLPPLGCSSDDMGEDCYDSLDEYGCKSSRKQRKENGIITSKSSNRPTRRSLPALPKEASKYSSNEERALQILHQAAVTESTLRNLQSSPASSTKEISEPELTTYQSFIDHHDSLEDLAINEQLESYEDAGDEDFSHLFIRRPYHHPPPPREIRRRDPANERRCMSLEPIDMRRRVSSTPPNQRRRSSGFLFLTGDNETDSGCQSLEGGANSCNSPSNDNKSEKTGLLWFGLSDNNDVVKRRPKKLSSVNSPTTIPPKHYRYSAPPGSGMITNSVDRRRQSRIHSAVVSGINNDTKSVTVEWFERGETKGKEIELEALLSLNQDLAPTTQPNNGGSLIPNKLPKSDKSSLSQTKSYVPRPTAINHRSNNSNQGSTGNNASTGTAPGMRNHRTRTNRQTMGVPSSNIDENSASPASTNGHGGGSENIPPTTRTTGVSSSDTVGKAAAGVNRRRSNVVKEVERLKKNREERRAKQAEILEEKEAQKNIDPGNPNWEFLSMIRDYQETLDFNPLQEGDTFIDHQISVCVRKRPLNKKEEKRREIDVVTMPNKDQIIIHEPKTKVDLTKYLDNQHFRFDYAFDDTATNDLVYKFTARPLVQNIFDGGMSTCFAYGQTGSGKTHTMGGEFHGKSQDSKNGIYALATIDVFKYLKSQKYKGLKLQVSCSYFEIYSGKVFDLLSGKSKLRVLEDGKQQVVVVGLTEKVVDSVEDVLKLITHGNNCRTSGQTSANAHSSRSHAVFQIILRHNKNKLPLYGKFSLIDLAGNERGADTSSADRQTRMEGAEINKSLLALKECIRALGRKGAHLPFRASKLTQVLRDSFIGEKSKTCMIAMISPALNSCEHSLNTLRYADRVKELGAADPATQPKISPSDNSPEMRMDDGVMSPEDSDLAQLRSLNEGELSADWYNFQEAVTHLQALEDDLVESHRSTIEMMPKWIQDDADLLAVTNEVDYDQDAYCQNLEEMISEKINILTALREKARNFRECQNDEEAMSRKLFMHRN